MQLAKRLFVLLLSSMIGLCATATEELDDCEDCGSVRIYDGNVGPVRVGLLEVELQITDDAYEMEGEIAGAGPIKRLLNWRGTFTAGGTFADERPVTSSYFFEQDEVRRKKKEVKRVTVSGPVTRITETDKEDLEFPTPPGNDMMTAILLDPSCDEAKDVHDGENSFILELYATKPERNVKQGRNYWTGTADLCRYKVMVDGKEMRKLDLWIGEVDGRLAPVRIGVRIPLIPDGVFKLRIAEEEGEE